MERMLDPARLGDHVDRLYRAAWALCGSREDAEDLVQETYVRVLARPRLLRHEDDLGYLLRALRNTLPEREADAEPPAATRAAARRARAHRRSAGASAGRGPGGRRGARGNRTLPDDHRDVLVAVDIAGLSYKEASRALRIREGTVMSRLYRARQQVVRRVEGGSRRAG